MSDPRATYHPSGRRTESQNVGPHNLTSTYLRLGADSSIEPLKVDEKFWPSLMTGKFGDFKNEYLVTMLSFDEDWSSWEQHPNGDEFVFLISGSVNFVLEANGGEQIVALNELGQFVIVPKATWHTAKVLQPASMLFMTPGEGTLNRPI